MHSVSRAPALSATTHVPELDVLRGVAILLVLGVHSPGQRGESGFLRPLDGLLHQFGWTGVDLFFVLSGFLIGRLLFAEIQRSGRLDVKRFLLRRMFRIWPGYYVYLLYVVVSMSLQEPGGFGAAVRAMWPAFANVQNFVEVPRDQLWSLAIEEQFYLTLPFVLCLLLRRGQGGSGALRAMPWISLGLSVTCLLVRTALLLTYPALDVRAMFSMDSLFFGVTLAYLSVYRPELLPALARHRTLLLLASGLLFLPALVNQRTFRLSIAVTCLALGYGLLLVAFIHRLPEGGLVERFKTTWLARVVAAIGTYSYSIYLWHRDTAYTAYEVTRDFMHSLGAPGELAWLAQLLAYVLASVFSGFVMGKLIEAPALRLRDKLFPSRAAAAAPPRTTTVDVSHAEPHSVS